MMKSLRFMLGLVALGIVFGSMSMVAAQQRPIVGGYKTAAVDDPEVVAAAEFAVGEQGRKLKSTVRLISVEHAERQVVAGMNYRLCLKVEIEGEGDEAEAKDVKVTVFRSLKQEYSLKTWEEADCGEDASTRAIIQRRKHLA
jgi:Aspartic acid proteinase inhibitor